ncbi:MAG: TonB-dependent receptor [Betaproteobacteria bacterium]|nr:MAG: TonB-dependent receptor [Betaproteobacteria bacterium]
MKINVASRTKLSIAVSLALGAGFFSVGFAPLAQAQQSSDVQRVEVTGSRLPSLSLEGPSPVTVLNAQDIKFDGQTKAEELLNQLPAVAAQQTAAQANGSTGTAQVNLRNLGATRNLVLVNGRRLPPGSPTQGGYAADLNQVPVALIQRVELLTGGASGVYGSDAMSGVVNFIMNDKFEGLQINLNHSFYNHEQGSPIGGIVAARGFPVPGDVASDGDVHNASVLLGGNFASGRGNATVYFDWKKEDAVIQATRDFSACALNRGATFTCGGSGTSFPGQFLLDGGNGAALTVADAAGNTRPFAATDIFNFGPYNHYRRPSERYGFGAFAHYDVFKDLRVYSEIGFHTDSTLSQIAPSGLFFFDASGANAIRFENPLLSADWRAQIAADNGGNPFAAPGDTANLFIARRNIEGGGRQDDIRHSSFRFVFGMKGEAFKYWNYDVSMQTGRVDLKRTYLGDFSNTRIGRAMNVVTDGNGNPACASVVDGTDPNCVPYNIWRLGGVTGAALQYLQVPGLANGFTQQQIVTTNWSADLGNYGIKLPTAQNGVSIVLGAERRKEKMDLQTDNSFATGDLAGQGGATVGRAGKVQVGEYFGELRVPFIEKRPMFDLLQASASYRYSKYSTRKKTNTYGVGLEWAPVSAYRLRGSYQRAVRAANLEELFLAQGNNLFDLNEDPCGPSQTATLAQCANTGITPAQYGSAILDSPAGQYNFLQGGNPNLDPESADTYTLGLAFQPIRNLTGSIDYWSINIDKYISAAPPDVILNQCLFSANFCNLVQRDALGTLWLINTGRVVALTDNLGGLMTKGWDFALNYNHGLGAYGRLGFHFLGTLVDKWEFEPIKGLGKFDCVGLVGSSCGTPNPKWRHKFRVNWQTPWNVDMALTWRHISKIEHEGTSSNPLLAGNVFATDRELAKRDYLDIAAAWRINRTFTLSGGINNITDKDPPIVSQQLAGPSILGNGNTFPGVYDTLGRLVFVNLQAKF